jgi:chromosome partitioning protein
VLLVDLDPQGNATMASASTSASSRPRCARCYSAEAGGRGAHRRTREGYDLLPTNIDLAGGRDRTDGRAAARARLKNALDTVRDRYDYILIDCPPSLSLLTLNALAAADA